MSKKRIWVAIVGSGVIASITTAAAYFPDYKAILVAGAGLVAAVIAFVANN